MGYFVTDCPHCGAASSTFRTFGAHVYAAENPSRPGTQIWGSVGATCAVCSRPVAGYVVLEDDDRDGTYFTQALQRYVGSDIDLRLCGLKIAKLWPERRPLSVPPNLPPEVSRVLMQAERNFAAPQNPDAAGVMYRKTLEVALKLYAPEVKGWLAQRIKTLAAEHRLTPELAAWAEHLKSLGDSATHDVDEPLEAELEKLRALTDLILRYLYTLPAMVREQLGPIPDEAGVDAGGAVTR